MSKQEDGRKIFNRLMERFASNKPIEQSLLPHETKALNMQRDLKGRLKKFFPLVHGNHDFSWAVRTSMDEIGNAAAFDEILSEFDETLQTEAKPGETTLSEIARQFREERDTLNKKSIDEAYVIVEFYIDHPELPKSPENAQRFFGLLDEVVGKHKPDETEIRLNSLSLFAREGIQTGKKGANFEATYRFLRKK